MGIELRKRLAHSTRADHDFALSGYGQTAHITRGRAMAAFGEAMGGCAYSWSEPTSAQRRRIFPSAIRWPQLCLSRRADGAAHRIKTGEGPVGRFGDL